jgi:hypothetical protein
MLTITGYRTHTTKDGSKFTSLEISGGLEMIQSQSSGQFYAKARKCSIPFTAGVEAAKAMIGNTLPGTIQRVPCPAYDYTLQSGETLTLSHRYQYQPEEAEGESIGELQEMDYPSEELEA